MVMPAGNIFWKDVPPHARVVDRGHYYEVVDGRKRFVAYWTGQDAREAQGFLKRRASIGKAR